MDYRSTLEGKIDALSKKIDNQSRFTRSVILLCTAAILAVVFYTITEVLSTLPASIVSLSENLYRYRTSHSGNAATSESKLQPAHTLQPGK
jgi:hypothetical protein